MKKILFLLLIFWTYWANAQYTYTPSTGNSLSPFTNYTCNGSTYLGGNTIYMSISISGNTGTFTLKKYNGTSFSTAGNFYLKETNACGSILASGSVSAGSSSKQLTKNLVSSSSSTTYSGVYITNVNGVENKYYTGTITVNRPCATPSNLSGSNITENSYTANWNSVTGATGYSLENILSSSSYSGVLSTSTSTSKSFSGLNNGATYKFQVSANCSNGINSLMSGSSSNIPLTPPLSTPTLTSPINNDILNNTYVSFNWNKNGNPSGTSYQFRLVNTTDNQTIDNYTPLNDVSTASRTLQAGKSYQWVVRATKTGNLSKESGTGQFSIAAPAPGLTISTPPTNSWGFGQNQTIQWTTSNGGCGPYIIEVSTNGGSNWTVIANNVSGTSFYWAVGKDYQNNPIPNMVNNSNLKIKVYCSSQNSVNSTSNSFSLATPSITVTTPPTLTVGQSQVLSWSVNNAVCTQFTIELSSTAGSTPFYLLKTYNPATTYSWTVPNDQNGNEIPSSINNSINRLKVYCTEYSDINGLSSSFTITRPPLAVTPYTVTPSTGTQDYTSFKFQAGYTGGDGSSTGIDFVFKRPNGTFVTISSPSSEINFNNTTNRWELNKTMEMSGTYEYKYIIYQGATASSASNWYSFNVSPPITIGNITSPINWHCNKDITWSSIGVTGNVSIELYKVAFDGDAFVATIASPIPNSSPFTWMTGKKVDPTTLAANALDIPDFQTNDTYKLKMYQTGTTGKASWSNTFTFNNPSLSVSSPVTQTVYNGQQVDVNWSVNNFCNTISIEIVPDGAIVGTPLASQIPTSGPHTLTIPNNLPPGQYKMKVYAFVTSGGSPAFNYSPTFTVANQSVSVPSPALNSNYYHGANLPITWAFNGGYTGNVTIELTKGTASSVSHLVLFNNITNDGNETYLNLPNTLTQGPYRIKVYNVGAGEGSNPTIVGYSDVFNIGPDPACPACLNPSLSVSNFTRTGVEGLCAAQYLCSKGIIQPQQNSVGATPSDEIKRVDLAKLMLYALFDDGNAGLYHASPGNYDFPVDRYVTPFEDLNYSNTATNYDRPAKIMSYLFYANDARGRTPFKRSRNNFYPYESISRMDFLQVLLEAWNVAYDGGPAVPYTDDFTNVPVETMQYIKKAYALGIITFNAATNDKFRPYDNITREEAFLILSRLRKHATITKPAQSEFTGVNNNNYILERSITTDNVSLMRSMAEGNFVYSQGGFAIPDIGFPLSFGFTYNSFITQLPDIYRRIEPLGQGWTHNFNSYIIKTPASVNANSVVIGKPRILVANGDGTWHTFDNTNENNPVFSSIDNFNTLTKVNSTTYELKRPDMVVFRYESQGSADAGILRLKSITDRYGNRLTMVYKLGTGVPFSGYQYVLDYVQSKSGKKAVFTYNERNQITEISFPGETVATPRKLKFAYENGWDDFNHNFLRRFYSPKFANQTTKSVIYEYGTGLKSKLLVSIKSPKGNTIKTEFDSDNKLSKIEANDGGSQNTATTTFNRSAVPGCPANMTCVSSTNANGTTNYQIEENGNMKYIQTPTAIVNRPESVNSANPSDINPSTPSFYEVNGDRAEYVYNAAGYVTNSKFKKATGSAFIQESYTYQSLTNNLATYTDPNGHTSLYNWSTDGKFLNSIQTPFANNQYLNQNFTYYSATGQLQSIINHEGLTNTFFYDAFGNLERSNYVPLNLNSTATYDYSGRIKTATNPKNQTSQVWFDANDNLTKERAPSPLNYETQYGFDDNDNLTTITNARGKITTLGYDDFDRNDELSFEGLTQKYFYTTDGKLDKYEKSGFPTDNSRFYKYDYDAKGRLTANGYIKEILFNNTTQNLQSVKGGTNPAHFLKEFGYDDYNRMTSYKDHYNNVVGYEYDNNGNVLKITYPGTNKFVIYNYDWANRLSKVYWNGNSGLQTIAEYYYNGSRLDYVQYGNGVRTTYSYDNAGRLAGYSTNKNSGTGAVIAAYSFEFDNVGNHLTENITEPYQQPTLPAETISYSYDDGNRILTMNNVTFTHDGDGNVKTKGNRTFTYDLEDNLTKIEENGVIVAQYEYDAFGNRRWAKRGSTETRYVLDLLGLADVLAETNTSNAIQNYYIHGMGLVARVKADGTLHYYHGDYRGSVVAMTNASQAITHQYQYDDFGKLLNETEADANPFKYVGLYGIMHEGSDLAYMRARYYDPETGRFNGADPIWNANLYPYANNNGVMRFDPSGEIAPLIALAGVGALVGGVSGGIGYYLANKDDFSWKGLFSASIDGAAVGIVTSVSFVGGALFAGLLPGLDEYNSSGSISNAVAIGSMNFSTSLIFGYAGKGIVNAGKAAGSLIFSPQNTASLTAGSQKIMNGYLNNVQSAQDILGVALGVTETYTTEKLKPVMQNDKPINSNRAKVILPNHAPYNSNVQTRSDALFFLNQGPSIIK